MKQYDYIFFDVANTLLHKPQLFPNIEKTLKKVNSSVSLETIKYHHKLLSESIKFPDKTSREFYNTFNAELCMSLGIIPSEQLLTEIFESCTYLDWQPFDDVHWIEQLNTPTGIISNWDLSLKDVLSNHFELDFKPIIGSKELGTSKPDPAIFKHAQEKIDSDLKDVLFIGDSIKLDMLPAMNHGWDVLLIDRGNYFKAFPHRISSFEELKDKISC